MPFLNSGYASGSGGACGGRDDDEEASSGWGADAELVGRVGGGAGGWKVVAFCIFWLVGGFGRVCLFSAALALAGLEVVGLEGRGVRRRDAWPAGQGFVAGAPPAFAWSLSRGCA